MSACGRHEHVGELLAAGEALGSSPCRLPPTRGLAAEASPDVTTRAGGVAPVFSAIGVSAQTKLKEIKEELWPMHRSIPL